MLLLASFKYVRYCSAVYEFKSEDRFVPDTRFAIWSESALIASASLPMPSTSTEAFGRSVISGRLTTWLVGERVLVVTAIVFTFLSYRFAIIRSVRNIPKHAPPITAGRSHQAEIMRSPHLNCTIPSRASISAMLMSRMLFRSAVTFRSISHSSSPSSVKSFINASRFSSGI